MAHEFIARNGLLGLANSTISGSLAVSQSVTAQSFTGSLSGSATTATSASYALTASSAQNATSASYVLNAVSASFSTLAQIANTASFVTLAQTASYVLNAVSSSRAVSASRADSAVTASYVLNAVSSSFATNATGAFVQGGNSFGAAALIGTNDNQNINIETNGITRLTVSNTGNISAAVSASSRPILENTVIDLHPESSGFNILPFFASDIAYTTLRGGTFTGTPGPGSTYVTPAATAEAMFDGSSTYAAFNSTDLSGSYTASIAFPQSYQYGNTIGFSFGNASWRAQNFKVEILVTGSYYTLDTVTGFTGANYNKNFGYGAENVQGAKITFSNFAGSGFRIADIYLLNYNSQLGKTVFVGRDGGAIHKSIAVTGSVIASTGFTGSLLGTATTASYVLNAVSSSRAVSASRADSAVTASYVLNAVSASFATSAVTASYVLNAVSASNAATASSADNFTVRGTLTAQTIVAQTITSSIDFVTGSSRNGSLLANTHQFTGSVSITGSLSVNGSNVILSNQTSSMSVATASYILNAVSSSYSSISNIVNGASGQLFAKDDRIIEPNSISSRYAQFGFTSWNNNNASPYADYLHLRSYQDGSGGNDNLVSFNKSTIGMRIWQQSWNSASAYDNYRDVALVSGSATGYIPLYQSATVLTGSTIFQNGLNIGINTIIPNSTLTVNGNTSITGSVTSTVGFTGSLSGSATTAISASYALFALSVPGMPTGSSYAAFTQASPATTWTFNHNLGYLYPVVTVYDANSNQIIPSQVSASSINQLQIIFSSARTGYATAVIGSATPTPSTINVFTAVGANTLVGTVTGSYNSAFFNYSAVSASNARAGQIMTIWTGSAISFSETTTNDIGNTSGVTFTASLSGNTIAVIAGTTSANWNIKLTSAYL
jgi:hypothetical protein